MPMLELLHPAARRPDTLFRRKAAVVTINELRRRYRHVNWLRFAPTGADHYLIDTISRMATHLRGRIERLSDDSLVLVDVDLPAFATGRCLFTQWEIVEGFIPLRSGSSAG